MYKIETHLHTCHSSPCGKADAETIAKLYAQAGFSGIVVTDHYFRHTCNKWGWNIPFAEFFHVFTEGYRQLSRIGATYGLKIYRGAEVRFDGSTNDYLLFDYPDALLQDPESVFTMGLEAFSQKCRECGALLIQAHPFRKGCTRVDLRFLDGIEVYNLKPSCDSDNASALALADSVPGLIRLSGSDFHSPVDTAQGGIVTDILPENEAALAELLRRGEYTLYTGKTTC